MVKFVFFVAQNHKDNLSGLGSDQFAKRYMHSLCQKKAKTADKF